MNPEIEENGEFTFENLLKSIDAIVPVSFDDFLENTDQMQPLFQVQQYRDLANLLQSHLSDLQAYSYCFPSMPSSLFAGGVTIFENIKGVPVIIGSTSTREWIGLAPKQYNTTKSSPQFNISEPTVDETITDLVQQLKEITNSLAYPIREYELTKAQPRWAIALTNSRETIIEKILDEAQFTDIREVNSILRISGNYEIADRELKLNEFFNFELTNSRVYNLDFIIGGEHLTIHYVMGKTSSDDWVGVVTDSFTC